MCTHSRLGGRRPGGAWTRAGLGTLLLVVVASAPARADWYAIPGAALTFGGSTNLVDLENAAGGTRLGLQGSLLWLGQGWFGVDAEVAHVSGFFEGAEGRSQIITDSGVLTAVGSVVLTLPLETTRHSLRPYAMGGFGLIRASIKDTFNVYTGSEKLMGLRVGGGATGFLTDTVGVRFDLSYFRTLKGQGNETGVAFGSRSLSFWRASTGIVLRL